MEIGRFLSKTFCKSASANSKARYKSPTSFTSDSTGVRRSCSSLDRLSLLGDGYAEQNTSVSLIMHGWSSCLNIWISRKARAESFSYRS